MFELCLAWFFSGCAVVARGMLDPIDPPPDSYGVGAKAFYLFFSMFILIPLWPVYVIVRFFAK